LHVHEPRLRVTPRKSSLVCLLELVEATWHLGLPHSRHESVVSHHRSHASHSVGVQLLLLLWENVLNHWFLGDVRVQSLESVHLVRLLHVVNPCRGYQWLVEIEERVLLGWFRLLGGLHGRLQLGLVGGIEEA